MIFEVKIPSFSRFFEDRQIAESAKSEQSQKTMMGTLWPGSRLGGAGLVESVTMGILWPASRLGGASKPSLCDIGHEENFLK